MRDGRRVCDRIDLPIHATMASKGLAAKEHMLTAFGGGGGQHACAVAHALGISSIYIHQYASVLSPFGIAMADIEHRETELCARELSEQALDSLRPRLEQLQARVMAKLAVQGFQPDAITIKAELELRFRGTNTPMTIPFDTYATCREAFISQYRRECGFVLGAPLLIDRLLVCGAVVRWCGTQPDATAARSCAAAHTSSACRNDARLLCSTARVAGHTSAPQKRLVRGRLSVHRHRDARWWRVRRGSGG